MSEQLPITLDPERETYIQALDDEGTISRTLGEVRRRDTDLLGPDGRRLIAVRAPRPIGFHTAPTHASHSEEV